MPALGKSHAVGMLRVISQSLEKSSMKDLYKITVYLRGMGGFAAMYLGSSRPRARGDLCLAPMLADLGFMVRASVAKNLRPFATSCPRATQATRGLQRHTPFASTRTSRSVTA